MKIDGDTDSSWMRALARRVFLQITPRGRELQRLREVNLRLSQQNRALGKLHTTAVSATSHWSQESHGQETADISKQYVVVLTYGRSGSTLVQGILNSLPGWQIRGENAGVIQHLHEIYSHLTEAHALHAPAPLPSYSWYGIGAVTPDLVMQGLSSFMVDTILQPAADARVLGFKEIRWDYEDLSAQIDFLKALFPGVRVIVNLRNIDVVAKSGWWANHENARGELERIRRSILIEAERLGNDAYVVHYEEYTQSVDSLIRLMEWLGEEFDRERLTEVLRSRHSS